MKELIASVMLDDAKQMLSIEKLIPLARSSSSARSLLKVMENVKEREEAKRLAPEKSEDQQ